MASPDLFGDVAEFTKLRNTKLGKEEASGGAPIDRKFITQMIMDELDELKEAKDEAEEVDALLDAVYYALQHLSTTGLDCRPIWQLIHKANMTKFGSGGHLRNDGKWMKPPDFVAPDEAIRAEIVRQRAVAPVLPVVFPDKA